MRFIFLLSTFLIASLSVHSAEVATPQSSKSPGIIPYLERIVEWNRTVVSAEQLMDKPREAVLGDKLHQDAQTVLQKSFDYAHAEATIFTPDQDNDNHKDNDAKNGHNQLSKMVADINSQVAGLQSQLDKPRQSPKQKEQLAGELKLAQARQALLQALLSVGSSENDGSLLDQINSLSRTALAEAPNKSKSPITDTLQTKPSSQESHGIFGLSEALMTASEKQGSIDTLLKRTEKIKETTHGLITSTRADLKDALAQGDALTVNSGQATEVAAYRQSVDELVGHYKKLSSVIIPLGESNASLDNVIQNLKEWKKMTGESEVRLFHQLLIRLLILIISIAVPLICSSIAHRTIVSLTDTQKRKQLDLARRVLLIIALILIVLVNFLTEFGSLATFAGFLTAGLAVGLQTVLVSMVAHSLYFGRYGIHVGDRIRVTDVTGEVIQMGMLRLYMSELKETDKGFVPTGRIVAFPNSVMFQPSALYKYADESDIKI